MNHLLRIQRGVTSPFGKAATGWRLLLLVVGLLSRAAHAQTPTWQTATAFASTTSQGSVEATASATDASGNVYLCGNLRGTAVFGGTSLVSSGDFDVFVAKWNRATGSFGWAVRLGGTGADQAQCIAVSSAGIFVAGQFFSPTFAAGPVTLTNQGSSGGDIYVVKLTDAGSSAGVTWAQRAGGTGFDYAYGLAVSGSSVYLTGSFSSATASFGNITLTSSSPGSPGITARADLYVAKLTDAGTTASFAWVQQAIGAGGGSETGQALAVSGPNVYVVGQFYFSASVAFGSSVLTGPMSDNNVFVAKLTDAGATGSFGWAVGTSSTGSGYGYAVAASGPNVYIGGQVSGTSAVFGSIVLPLAGNEDGFVAKLVDGGSSAGFVWAQRAGGAQGDAVTTLVAQGAQLYCAGYFGSSISNPGAPPTATFGTITLQSLGFIDAFVGKLTDAGPTGSFAWVQQAGSTSVDYIKGLALVGTSVYAAGVFYGPTCVLGPLALSNAQSPNGAGFLASLTDPTLTATTAALRPESIGLFPNPAHGRATVQLPSGSGPATLTLLDALGRTLRTYAATASADLDLTGLAPGLYAVRVAAGGGTATRRLVVE